MATVDIVIPQVGEAVDEVTLLAWEKAVGDRIAEGDVLFLVDTDKAVVDIPAFTSGVLTEIIVGPDSRVVPLQVVGRLTTDGAAPVEADEAATSGAISPRARRIADELGVDPNRISGTGPGGMVTEADVRSQQATDRAKPETMRQSIARRTTASKATVPHFYVEMDADFSRLYAARRAAGSDAPSLTAAVVYACAQALTEMPAANVSYRGDRIEHRSTIGVAVTVSVADGLVNVTLPDIGGLDMAEVGRRLQAAAERARTGHLGPDDLAAKSMVVSNLGMYGVDAFTAIIDVPDPMILAVGRVASRPVADGDEVVIRPMARLTLSVDHRVLDGVSAALFLGEVRRRLEDGA